MKITTQLSTAKEAPQRLPFYRHFIAFYEANSYTLFMKWDRPLWFGWAAVIVEYIVYFSLMLNNEMIDGIVYNHSDDLQLSYFAFDNLSSATMEVLSIVALVLNALICIALAFLFINYFLSESRSSSNINIVARNRLLPLSILIKIYMPLLMAPQLYFVLKANQITDYINLPFALFLGLISATSQTGYAFRDTDSLAKVQYWSDFRKFFVKIVYVTCCYLVRDSASASVFGIVLFAYKLIDQLISPSYLNQRIRQLDLQMSLTSLSISLITVYSTEIKHVEFLLIWVLLATTLSFKAATLITYKKHEQNQSIFLSSSNDWENHTTPVQVELYARSVWSQYLEESHQISHFSSIQSSTRIHIHSLASSRSVTVDYLDRQHFNYMFFQLLHDQEYDTIYKASEKQLVQHELFELSAKKNFAIDYIEELFKRSLAVHKQFSETHLSYLFFLHDCSKNQPLFSIKLLEIQQRFAKTTSFHNRCIINHLSTLANSFNTSHNVFRVVEFDNKLDALTNLIKTTLQQKEKFLQAISNAYIDLDAIEIIGKNLLKQRSLIAKQIREIITINNNNYLLDFLVSSYQFNIAFEHYKFFKQLPQHQHPTHMISPKQKKDIFSKNSSVLFISILQEDFGKIRHVSNSIFRVFEYEKQDLINKNCSFFMPRYIADVHDLVIKKYIQRGYFAPKQFNEKQPFFVVNKLGFLSEVRLHLQLSMVDSNSIGISALMSTTSEKQDDCLAVANIEQGYQFSGCTRQLFEDLFSFSLESPSNLKHLNLKQVIPIIPLLVNKNHNGSSSDDVLESNEEATEENAMRLQLEKAHIFQSDQIETIAFLRKNTVKQSHAAHHAANSNNTSLLDEIKSGAFCLINHIVFLVSLRVRVVESEHMHICQVYFSNIRQIGEFDLELDCIKSIWLPQVRNLTDALDSVSNDSILPYFSSPPLGTSTTKSFQSTVLRGIHAQKTVASLTKLATTRRTPAAKNSKEELDDSRKETQHADMLDQIESPKFSEQPLFSQQFDKFSKMSPRQEQFSVLFSSNHLEKTQIHDQIILDHPLNHHQQHSMQQLKHSMHNGLSMMIDPHEHHQRSALIGDQLNSMRSREVLDLPEHSEIHLENPSSTVAGGGGNSRQYVDMKNSSQIIASTELKDNLNKLTMKKSSMPIIRFEQQEFQIQLKESGGQSTMEKEAKIESEKTVEQLRKAHAESVSSQRSSSFITQKKIIMNSLSNVKSTQIFNFIVISSTITLVLVCAIIVYTYLKLDQQFEIQKKSFYYISWGLSQRMYISRVNKNFIFHPLMTYSSINQGYPASVLQQRLATSSITLYENYMDQMKEIVQEALVDLYIVESVTSKQQSVQIYLNDTYYETYTTELYTALLQMSYTLLQMSNNTDWTLSAALSRTLEQSLLTNLVLLIANLNTQQKGQENDISTLYDQILQNVVILLIVVCTISAVFVLSTFPVFTVKQLRKERVLQLFATIDPLRIREMHKILLISLISLDIQSVKESKDTSRQITNNNNNSNTINVKRSSNKMNQSVSSEMKQIKVKDTRLFIKKKQISSTSFLPRSSVALILKSIVVYGVLIVYPIVNYVTTVSLISQSNNNQTLAGLLQTVRVQIASTIGTFGMVLNAQLNPTGNTKFYSQFLARYANLNNQNDAIFSAFQRQIFAMKEQSRYFSDEYDSVFFEAITGNVCTVIQNDSTFVSSSDLSLNSCNNSYDSIFKSGVLTTSIYIQDTFLQSYDIFAITDSTSRVELLNKYLATYNMLELNEIFTGIMGIVDSLGDFLIEKNNAFFGLMSTVQTALMLFQFAMLFLLFKFGLVTFSRSTLKDLTDTRNTLTIMQIPFLVENSYIMNYLSSSS